MAADETRDDLSFNIFDPRFADATAAAEYLESIRWPDGPVCPHCGESERKAYRLNVKGTKRRLWKCAPCRKQFTVTVGTIFEDSHVPLNKWLLAFYLLCSSKKGMSSHQLHRMLGVQYKTAWFMTHRIREAMKESPFQKRLAGVVEADEPYVDGKERNRKTRDKQKRDGPWCAQGPGDGVGRARRSRPQLDVINHQWHEYVVGDVHTNTAENYFSILKRGIDGVYHHVSEAHLPRYLAEFDFRYNNRVANGIDDGERTRLALQGAEGKRLQFAR